MLKYSIKHSILTSHSCAKKLSTFLILCSLSCGSFGLGETSPSSTLFTPPIQGTLVGVLQAGAIITAEACMPSAPIIADTIAIRSIEYSGLVPQSGLRWADLARGATSALVTSASLGCITLLPLPPSYLTCIATTVGGKIALELSYSALEEFYCQNDLECKQWLGRSKGFIDGGMRTYIAPHDGLQTVFREALSFSATGLLLEGWENLRPGSPLAADFKDLITVMNTPVSLSLDLKPESGVATAEENDPTTVTSEL